MIMKKILIMLSLVVSTGAAAQVKYIPLNGDNKEYPELERNDVQVFMSKDNINKKYTELGLIVCKVDSDKRTFKKAKKRAAAHGANAIYLLSEKDKTGTEKVLNTLLMTGYTDETKFVAIRLE